jgi:hypothetical protein
MNKVQFQDDLLQEMADLCGRTLKSVRYRGKLDIERGGGDGEHAEWLRILFKPGNGPATIVEVLANRLCNVYVRSTRRSDRGKVLVRIELMSVTANASRIVETIANTFRDADYTPESEATIRSHWRQASLTVATPNRF